jgi:hypothetical protein
MLYTFNEVIDYWARSLPVADAAASLNLPHAEVLAEYRRIEAQAQTYWAETAKDEINADQARPT